MYLIMWSETENKYTRRTTIVYIYPAYPTVV